MKPSVSRAKRMVMASRMPIMTIVKRQQARVAELDERIGRLQGQRVEQEEILAEFYALKLPIMIERQKPRIAKLDERIGKLMNQRVDEEEVLADLYKLSRNESPTGRQS